MRRAFLLWLALACAACGSGAPAPQGESDASEAPAEAEVNSAPVVASLGIVPDEPTSADGLSASLEASDDDRDRLRVHYQWYINGQRLPGADGETLQPGSVKRGDQVYVVAGVSDGTDEVEARSEPVSIGNAAPRVVGIRVSPPEATTSDILTAEAQAVDADGDPLSYEYRWFVNGQAVEGATSARLEAGKAVRGDEVVVHVAARDETSAGEWVPSDPLRMGNAAPEITTRPVYELSGSATYRYEVSGRDPDGDRPLKYELLTGPAGMVVDAASGVVTWEVPSDAKGTYDVELAVSDPHGARTLQRYALDVNWEVAPASPAASVPGAAVPRAAASESGMEVVDDEAELDEPDESDELEPEEDQEASTPPAPRRSSRPASPPSDDESDDEQDETGGY